MLPSPAIPAGKGAALLAMTLSFTCSPAVVSNADIAHDAGRKLVTLADPQRTLILRLNYDGKCLLDQVWVRGRQVVLEGSGVCSGIKVDGQWNTTRSGIAVPQV